MPKARFQAALFFFLFPVLSYALPYYGAAISYSLIPKDPNTLHGYQLMAVYDPQKFQWRQFNIYFDGGFSHYWVTKTPFYTNLNIYSIAPVIRNTFEKRGPISPYLEISIGLAYLNHTRIDNRNLGIHFAFQDRLGIGAYIGSHRQFSLGIHAVHYSNAHLSKHNSGVSIPLELDLGYRFQA